MDELLALANTAGTTTVALLATDGFGKVKAVLGGLWRRVHPDRAGHVEQELDQARAELISARAAGDILAEQALVTEWQDRLHRLLRTDPEAAVPLRRLLDEMEPVLQALGPHAQASRTGSIVQTGGGFANTGVVTGDVTIKVQGG